MKSITYICLGMPRFSNQHIITSLQNGEESVMFYLSRKYFEPVRKLLRSRGCREQDTPAIFSTILINVCREIQKNRVSPNVDFELYFFNVVKEHLNDLTLKGNQVKFLQDEREVVASCFSILDESSRKILALKYCESQTFEQIASRLEFSNPVIAHFEFNKAFVLFENIVRARLNIQST